MRTSFLGVLLASAAATPAFAQATGSPFTGPRVEGVVGYDRFSLGEDGDLDDGIDNSIDGVVYGVQGGFDFDLGGLVAGVEAEFTDSTGDLEGNDGAGTTANVRAGRDLYIGGRIGFNAGDKALIYAKAGYTNTSIEADETNGVDTFELNTEVDGYRLGAGVEYLFGTNLYGKVEYRYSNYSSLGDADAEDLSFDVDLDRHQVVAGLGVRF